MTTFLYALSDPNTGKMRYVGKSDNPFKRFRDHCRKFKLHNTAASKWIGSLAAKGQRPLMDILDEVPISEWPLWEREYIRVFRAINIPLLNLTDGGEGGNLSPECRERGVAKLRGRKLTPEHIKAATAHHLGRVRPEKTRQAISKALTGRVFSKKHRENMGLAHRGIPLSESHKTAYQKPA